MQSYQEGNQQAFDELYKRYKTRVFGYFMKKVQQPGEAEELFQRFFLRFHEKREVYDSRYALAPWIFTICQNLYVDWVRQRARYQERLQNYQAEAEHSLDSLPDADKPWDGVVGDQMAQLNPRYRQAIQLRYQEGYEFEDIARQLATTPSTARKIVSRAVAKLKAMLGEQRDDR